MVITCSNCGGHTLLKERYGKCDWCGSPLEAEQMPIPPPSAKDQYLPFSYKIKN